MQAHRPPRPAGNFLLILLLLLLAAGCQKQEADPAKKANYQGPIVESDNVKTLMSDSAKLQIRLTAPLEQQFENSDLLYPKSVQVTFYNPDGKTVKSTLRSNYGKYDRAKDLYIMRGDVRVRNAAEHQRMYTEELFYNKLKNLVYTDSAMFAKVVTPTDSLTGYGLTYNMLTGRYRFLRPTGSFITQLNGNDQ